MKQGNLKKIITKNKKAYFDYEILNHWEAGIVLKGYETKSVANSQVNLKGSYIVVINNELYIKNMYISPWKAFVHKTSIDSERERKILLHKKTISFLSGKIKEPGYSVLPLDLYFSGNLIKVKVGLAKGRKLYQKKQILKERSMDREAKLMMKKFLCNTFCFIKNKIFRSMQYFI